jgi:homopolymeric O-antigen transport system ATP-binding protein
MSKPIIETHELSKLYNLGTIGPNTAREALTRWWNNAARSDEKDPAASRENGYRQPQSNTIWALKDVSFCVNQQEIVGIIGRNGAGKSTLLKLLSRITAPTSGWSVIRGRVASLLEVGTGFHPELTGRNNIYLNGAILGMRKAEIDRKFDEIVAFAEIEKFVDTPVKRYSSGMYVRLAFAVAAHLEPEILLIDEVLAVGDAAFQKKCLGKMGDVVKEGRTILFVSHNMGAVMRVCNRCIWLQEGSIQEDGATSQVIQSYIRSGTAQEAVRRWQEEAHGDEDVVLRAVRVCQPEGIPTASIDITKGFQMEIDTDVNRCLEELTIAAVIINGEGQIVLHTADLMNLEVSKRQAGRWTSICQLPPYALNAGIYSLSVAADIPNKKQIFSVENVLTWNVEALSKQMGRYNLSSWKGIIGPGLAKWSLQDRNSTENSKD